MHTGTVVQIINRQTDQAHNNQISMTFHQWTRLCTSCSISMFFSFHMVLPCSDRVEADVATLATPLTLVGPGRWQDVVLCLFQRLLCLGSFLSSSLASFLLLLLLHLYASRYCSSSSFHIFLSFFPCSSFSNVFFQQSAC